MEIGATEVVCMEEPKWRESISIELEEENCLFEARLYLVDD